MGPAAGRQPDRRADRPDPGAGQYRAALLERRPRGRCDPRVEPGAAIIVEVAASTPDPQAEGRLVHLSGPMQPATAARDPVFGVTGDALLRLSRSVEMYQWKQETSTAPSNRSAARRRRKRRTAISKCGRRSRSRPASSAIPTVIRTRRCSSVGDVDGRDVKLAPTRSIPSCWPRWKISRRCSQPPRPPPAIRPPRRIYRGPDPGQPAIGDIRVSFAAVPAQTVSVAAALAAGTLTAWRDTTATPSRWPNRVSSRHRRCSTTRRNPRAR